MGPDATRERYEPRRPPLCARLRRPAAPPARRDAAPRALLASPHKAPGDLVFCNALGRGLDYRDVGEGFRAAVKAAGLTGPGRLSLHSLRHTYASLLIAKGLDVVFVSRQLGHASPTTTLGVYAHLFEQVQHAATARAALEESYGAMVSTLPREPRDPARQAVVALLVAGESGQGGR